ncbi:TPA: hypothetical protein DDZ10_03240 [Candidatus Uhrbacteria bacterium]|nr:hypothetical protein [Candidatus Uhrbacteria bacterium]
MSKVSSTRLSQTLEYLGVGKNEADLYSTLLRYPASTVQELQTKTPFPRTMLYYVLNNLIAQGLVSSTKSSTKTTYAAESPDRLYDLLAKREEEFAAQAKTLRELVPTLKQKHRLAGKRPDVRIFEGMDAYKKALEEILVAKPLEILAFGDPDLRQSSGIEARETFDGRRRAKKIVKKVLLPDSPKARNMLSVRQYDDYTQFRFTDEDFGVDLLLFDGKLLYTTYADREPMTILIEDEALCTMQKQFFHERWERSEDATLTRYSS